MPTKRCRHVITETPPVQAAPAGELRGRRGGSRLQLGASASVEMDAGRNPRAAAEVLFEAMGSEQFDLDLEAVDLLNAQPAA